MHEQQKKEFSISGCMIFFLEEARPFLKTKIDLANRHASMSVPETPSGPIDEPSASRIANSLLDLIEQAFYMSEL
jgi:hypothetical protein